MGHWKSEKCASYEAQAIWYPSITFIIFNFCISSIFVGNKSSSSDNTLCVVFRVWCIWTEMKSDEIGILKSEWNLNWKRLHCVVIWQKLWLVVWRNPRKQMPNLQFLKQTFISKYKVKWFYNKKFWISVKRIISFLSYCIWWEKIE